MAATAAAYYHQQSSGSCSSYGNGRSSYDTIHLAAGHVTTRALKLPIGLNEANILTKTD